MKIFLYIYKHKKGFKLNRVGTWQSETGYKSCKNDSELQTDITGGMSIYISIYIRIYMYISI
jgi:hypothetical protein